MQVQHARPARHLWPPPSRRGSRGGRLSRAGLVLARGRLLQPRASAGRGIPSPAGARASARDPAAAVTVAAPRLPPPGCRRPPTRARAAPQPRGLRHVTETLPEWDVSGARAAPRFFPVAGSHLGTLAGRPRAGTWPGHGGRVPTRRAARRNGGSGGAGDTGGQTLRGTERIRSLAAAGRPGPPALALREQTGRFRWRSRGRTARDTHPASPVRRAPLPLACLPPPLTFFPPAQGKHGREGTS